MSRCLTIAGMIGGWTFCAAATASGEELALSPSLEPEATQRFTVSALDPKPYFLTQGFQPQRMQWGGFGGEAALDAAPSVGAITLERFGAANAWGLSFSSRLVSAEDAWGNGNVGNRAEVRIGQRLREGIGVLDASSKPGWFLFAGGGGQAITYSPGAQRSDSPGGAVRLQDRVRVGSVQAGVGVQHHGMEASLGYVRKDINFGDALTRQQHFAGVSFALRR